MSNRYAVFYSPTVAKGAQLSLLKTAFSECQLQASFYSVERCQIGPTPKADVLVAAGGDGTVNCVAAAAYKLGMPLGIIPVGTLNHFAKDMGLPLVPLQAVETLAKGKIVKVDIGTVAGKVFLNNASIGIYPSVVRARTQLQPYITKWPAALVAVGKVATKRLHLYKLHLTLDGQALERKSSMLFVGNNKYELAGTGLPSRNELQDGKLQAFVLKTKRVDRLLKTGLYSVVGKQLPKRYMEPFVGKNLWVEVVGRSKMWLAYDGEIARVSMPLEFKLEPKALQVITQKEA